MTFGPPMALWLLLVVIWGGAIAFLHRVATGEGPILSGAVSATVAIAIYQITRRQARRQLTLDLFKEYYTKSFAKDRSKASRFMVKHARMDWSTNDPYELGKGDGDLTGYGAVLRFWHRVAVLRKAGELDVVLLRTLLARELGLWHGLVFRPMKSRKDMYVLADLQKLVAAVRRRKATFGDGEAEARVRRTRGPAASSQGSDEHEMTGVGDADVEAVGTSVSSGSNGSA